MKKKRITNKYKFKITNIIYKINTNYKQLTKIPETSNSNTT